MIQDPSASGPSLTRVIKCVINVRLMRDDSTRRGFSNPKALGLPSTQAHELRQSDWIRWQAPLLNRSDACGSDVCVAVALYIKFKTLAIKLFISPPARRLIGCSWAPRARGRRLCSAPPAPGLYFSIPADNSSNRSTETFEWLIL